MQLSGEEAYLEIYNTFPLRVGERVWSLCMALSCAIGLMTQIKVYRLGCERFTSIPHHRTQEL